MNQAPVRNQLLIMLSTAQQIANYKVYKHYGCPGQVLALSSPVAVKNQWNYGMRALVEEHGGSFHELPHADTLRVDALQAEFEEQLRPLLDQYSPDTVLWNWTGAQKPHSTALYHLAGQAAQADRTAGAARRHRIVYADEVNLLVEGQKHTETLDGVLTANEILRVHNMRTKKKVPPVDPAMPEDLKDFLRGGPKRAKTWKPAADLEKLTNLAAAAAARQTYNPEEIEAAFTRPVDDKLVREAVKIFIRLYKSEIDQYLDHPLELAYVQEPIARAGQSKKHLTWLAQALNGAGCRSMKKGPAPQPGEPRPENSGTHFERVAQRRICDWHKAHGHRWISEMLFNLEVYHPSWNATVPAAGEFDCLLITKTGKFHAIDFKSAGKFGDFRRQNATLTLGGGAFANFYYLYPWLDCDLDPTSGKVCIDRPEHEQLRVDGIIKMDTQLGDRGIRFRTRDEDFDAELRKKLRLSP